MEKENIRPHDHELNYTNVFLKKVNTSLSQKCQRANKQKLNESNEIKTTIDYLGYLMSPYKLLGMATY